MSVPMISSDLERWDARDPLFLRISIRTRIRSCRLTKSDQIWHGNPRGERYISLGSVSIVSWCITAFSAQIHVGYIMP